MDPLGLALEQYNALGQFRETERGAPIEVAGTLATGEPFSGPIELARVIATERQSDFYRCLSQKLLTYALGRGLEYYDRPTLRALVAGLQRDHGRLQTLILGIVESPPFQMRRGQGDRLAQQSLSREHPSPSDPP
jgi:hypothetical protein